MTIQEIFEKTIASNASDIHMVVGIPPVIRVDGRLLQLSYPPLTENDVESMVYSILSPEQKEMLLNNKCIDFSYGFGGGDYGAKGRFRINLYFQRGTIAAAFRLLPVKVKTIEELRLPQICHSF